MSTCGHQQKLYLQRVEVVHLIIVFITIGSFAGSSSDVTTNDECKGLYSFVDFKASAVCFINPLITGRYVGIMTTKSQILQLCEVEVYSRGKLISGLLMMKCILNDNGLFIMMWENSWAGNTGI